jgi:hypothetical protein
MRTIHKFILNVTDFQRLGPCGGAKPLWVEIDPAGKPCIWFEINTDVGPKELDIYIVGTGNPIPDEAQTYLGSFKQERFVWHVYTT